MIRETYSPNVGNFWPITDTGQRVKNGLLLLWILLWILCPVGNAHGTDSADDNLAPSVATYFKQYCYRCHSETVQKGDRRLDLLPANMTASSDAATLLE